MPDVMFTITDEDYEKLARCATEEEREPPRQAKVLVLQALKLWPMKPAPKASAKAPAKASSAKPKAEALAVVTNGSVGEGA